MTSHELNENNIIPLDLDKLIFSFQFLVGYPLNKTQSYSNESNAKTNAANLCAILNLISYLLSLILHQEVEVDLKLYKSILWFVVVFRTK